MAEVKILIEGYTTADTTESEEEKTCPTISLIKDNDFVIITDPGVLESQDILKDKLKETLKDVEIAVDSLIKQDWTVVKVIND